MHKKYPSIQRQNMRHRGPIESKKMNRFYIEAEQNLKVVQSNLNAIKEKISSYNHDIEKFVHFEKKLDHLEEEIKMIGGFRK